MIHHTGSLLASALAAAVEPAGVEIGLVAVSAELRAASEGDRAFPVVLKVSSERPTPGETWPKFKDRIGDHLKATSDRLAATAGVEVHQLLYAANSLAATITADQHAVVASDPQVTVELAQLDPLVDARLVDVAADDIGLVAARLEDPRGLRGAGVRVAVLDSGVDSAHPALNVGDAVSTCGESERVPGDHGTHCAGIIASQDATFLGIAPDVELVDVKVLRANGSGRHTFIVRGIDEALDREVHICSMSLGFNHIPTTHPGGHGWACPDGHCPMCLAVDNASAEGVVMVVAAGNEHTRAQQLVSGNEGNTYDTELCCPGQARSAITVGSHSKRGFTPAPSSSNGPTAYAALKPELVAPGVQIMSTIPLPRDPAGVADVAAPRALQFGVKSGTSMATPVVAGACAILLERARATGGGTEPEDIRKLLLTQHVRAAGGPPHVMGEGRLLLDL